MNRFVRALAHGLERLAALLLGLADGDRGSRQRPVRVDGSPPPDWLRRMRQDPPRDWLERVRRGRPRWMKGSTPVAPPPRAPITELDDRTRSAPDKPVEVRPSPHRGGKMPRPAGSLADRPVSQLSRDRQSGEEGRPHPEKAGGGRLSVGVPPSPAPADQGAPKVQRPELPHLATIASKKEKRDQRWFEGARRARGETPDVQVAQLDEPRPQEQAVDDRFGLAWPPIEAPWDSGAVGPRRAAAPIAEGRPAISVVAPPAPGDARSGTVYEIDELPFHGDSENPWPALPADPPADEVDPITIWRGWERRQRLAQEQRGD